MQNNPARNFGAEMEEKYSTDTLPFSVRNQHLKALPFPIDALTLLPYTRFTSRIVDRALIAVEEGKI